MPKILPFSFFVLLFDFELNAEKLDFVLAEEDAIGWKHFSKAARKDVLRTE